MNRETIPMGDRRIILEHLRVFVAVAHSGGFNSAGQKLCRTQSAVTQSLQKLEEYLNCPLLERRKGHVTGLTEQGRRLLPEAREILGRLDNAVGLIQRPELKGHISLGIPDSFNTSQIQGAVARCAAMNKGLKIQITAGLSKTLAENLEQGLLDVVILQRHAGYRGSCQPVFERILLTERLHWVASRKINFREPEELPLVTFTEGCTSYRSAALETLAEHGKPYYLAFISGSYESVRSAIHSGFGVGVLPESEIDQKHIVLTEKDGFPKLPEVQVLLQTNSRSPVIRHFCELLESLPGFNA